MIDRAMKAMTFVILSTMLGGALGAWAGREIGRRSPAFMATIAVGRPDQVGPSFDAAGFGLGLGAVSGLFFGAGASTVIVAALALREAWVARASTRDKPSW